MNWEMNFPDNENNVYQIKILAFLKPENVFFLEFLNWHKCL